MQMIYLYYMKKLLIVLLFLFSLSTAGSLALDPAESLIKILPPGRLDLDGVIVSVSVLSSNDDFLFNLNIDNQSLEPFRLETGQDITLEGVHPQRERFKSEAILVLPNEKIKAELKFKKDKYDTDKILALKIKKAIFPVIYQRVDPRIAKFNDLDLTVVNFYPAEDINVSANGCQGVLFINSAAAEITQVILVNGDNPQEFKKIDYKYWFLSDPVTLDRQSFFLLRARPEDELRVLRPFGNEKNIKIKPMPRPADQYVINTIPERVCRGGDFLLRLFVRYEPRIERVTVQVFDKSIALKKTGLLTWEKRIEVPGYLALGSYQVKVYVKDERGVAVCTGFIEIL